MTATEAIHLVIIRMISWSFQRAALTFYDMRGQSVLTKAHAMSKPQMAVSEQYLYIYDQGFNTYSVYNSFSCLKTFTTDYPIYKIAGSDSGVYAVLTKANNYKGACIYL